MRQETLALIEAALDAAGAEGLARTAAAEELTQLVERAVAIEAAELRAAASRLLDRIFETYKAGNGKQVGIEADDGEKCWIVHSHEIDDLRAALAASEGEP